MGDWRIGYVTEEGMSNKQGPTTMLVSSLHPEYRQTEKNNDNVCRRLD